MEFLWILFALMALQPVLQRKFLEAARRKLIAKLEQKRGSRVILLAHRQETMSLLGFPLMRYIDINDSEAVLRAIQMTDPQLPLDLVLHTPGGLVLASQQIARAIHMHPGKVTVFVPHYAMSGGTLVALAADEIVMSPHAVLGPVDPQLDGLPAASILFVSKQKSTDELDDRTLILAHQAEMALQQLDHAVRELLLDDMRPDLAELLSKRLTQGSWTHDYGIYCSEAKALGLPVSDDMPEEVLQLMTLYPQGVRQSGSVEYLPGKRTAGAADWFKAPRSGA